ncbi:MAG: LysR family transcriptional regulator [Azorhizobium sp. 39-67-5]|jgi:DNA-binding transcriptional LysR family regulator|nr:MAG: LysR family transcriptional regulator [Azorhizobium sp. 39-67-5]
MPAPVISFELRHLRYFVASASLGSFRKAADILGVQESAISRRVRDLEDQIGASLFLRHSGGVNLTLAGQRFLSRARQALEQLDKGTKEVSAIGRADAGHLRVGVFSSLASGFLSTLLKNYDAKHPNINIDFHADAAKCHLISIDKFEMDIAFTIGNQNSHPYEATHLWNERVFIALWEGHPLTEKTELHWADLAHERFLVRPGGPGDEVRGYLTLRLGDLGYRPNVVVQNVGRYNLLGLVASRRGVAAALESETMISIPGLTYRPIVGELLPFFAITSPKNDNPAARTLLSLARSMSRTQGLMS